MLLLGTHFLKLKKKKSWKEFQSSVNKDTPISKIHRKIDWVEQKRDPYILVIPAKVSHAFPHNIQNAG